MLLVMTVLGVSAMRNTTLQERMAGNLRDSNLAFQSAERALREGEKFLRSRDDPAVHGANGLLTMQDDAGHASFWSNYAWGRETAERPPAVARTSLARPLYVIEELPPVPEAGGSERFGRAARRRLLPRHGASRRRHDRRGRAFYKPPIGAEPTKPRLATQGSKSRREIAMKHGCNIAHVGAGVLSGLAHEHRSARRRSTSRTCRCSCRERSRR